MGKALYRRYRSRSLAEVVGQGHITDALERSLKLGKIGHAYLFVGPRGTGKTSVARILAHEINGFDYELEDDYLDIIEIDAASNTGVDNIRDLREKAMIAPTRGKYKVYIIDEVHMLSKSAFNALLKTLEEPPEHVVFIMATTDAHKVPVTIASRSQSFVFRLADADTMFDYLQSIADKEGIRITDGALRVVVRRSGGSFRDAVSLLDQVSNLGEGEISEEVITRALGLPQDDLVRRLYEAYLNGSSDEVTGCLRQLAGQGVRAEIVAEELMGLVVENPCARGMILLERLVEVPRAGYPEVKLLLALVAGISADDFSKNGGLVAGTSAGGFSENGAGAGPSLRAAATSSLPLSSQVAKPPQTPPVEVPPTRSVKETAAGDTFSLSEGTSEGALEETVEEMAASHLLPAEREGRSPMKMGASPEVFSEKALSEVQGLDCSEQPAAKALEQSEKLTPKGLEWSELLATIKRDAPGIVRYIEDSDYEVVGEKLVIYAKKAFAKTQIEKKRDFILSRLPEGMGLEVLAGAKNVDAMIAGIAELMGGGEEVVL